MTKDRWSYEYNEVTRTCLKLNWLSGREDFMYRKQMKGLILFLFFSCILFVSDNVNALSKETQTMENIEKYTDPIPKTIPVKNMSIAITKKDKRIFLNNMARILRKILILSLDQPVSPLQYLR